MRFVLQMALRELRSSWRRLAFFFICVAIGVGTIVALRSLIQNVRVALMAEARTLTAGDVYLRSEQPWTEEILQVLERRLAGLGGVEQTETLDMTTMVRVADEAGARTKVVELRGVQAEFPFYGEFALGDGRAYSFDLLGGQGALVGPELLTQLGLVVGDQILIGEAAFTIRDVILAEPGRRLGLFSFGPRVLVDREALAPTGLLRNASRVDRQILLKLEESQIDPLVARLREDLADAFVRIRSYRRTEDRIERNLSRTENYLSLIGFVVLILGGIGVWSVTRVFVQQRLRSAAILKCLGATSGRVLSVYVAQVLMLGLGGSLLGVGLAQAAVATVPESLAQQAATATGLAEVSTNLTISAIVQGVTVGMLVSVLFALVPLLAVRDVKPLLLLRQGRSDVGGGVDWLRVAVVALVGGALVLVATWQAGSLEVAAYVVGGFTAVTMTLHILSRVLVAAIRPLQAVAWFPLRHAVLNLSRPGNQTRVILLAVGLGSFFIIGVRSLQGNLLSNVALELGDDSPDMFLIDVQQDQADGVRTMLSASVADPPELIPVLRARVTRVAGRDLQVDSVQAARRAGLGREYTITYRATLEENERIIAGTFWDERPSPELEVSIEESLREERGIQVGDVVSFDVLGREISARVTSVRSVEWDDSRSGGFMFLFRPGAFDDAPHSYVAFLRGPPETESRAVLQRDIVVRYPNISVIDGLEVLKTVRRVLDYVTLAITVVGGIALFSGGLILIGSVAMTKFQRLYEAAIFKTLGAKTRVLITMLVIEYGVLGLLAGTVGSVGALGLTWALTRQVFDIAWFPVPWQNVGGIAATAAVVGIVGVVSSLDVLRRKPLSTLRAE